MTYILRPKAEARMSSLTLSLLSDSYVSHLQRRGCTTDTVATCRRVLIRFQRFLTHNGAAGDAVKLSAVTDERLNAYVDYLQNHPAKFEGHPNRPVEHAKRSPFTVVKEIKTLRGFGTWLKQEGFANPFAALPIPKLPRYVLEVLSLNEIEKLLSVINPRTENGARQYAIVMLMLDTGLRIGEVAELRLPNLNLDHRQLKVMGKGQKERVVPFGQRTAQALVRYIQLRRATPRRSEVNQVFLAPDGEPMSRNSLEHVIRRLRIASDIPRLHAHLLRHTFAVNYLSNGGDLRTLQLILGHESLIVTQRYLHLTNTFIQARYESNSPMDKLKLNSERPFGSRQAKRTP